MLSIGIGSETSTGGVVIEGNAGLLFDGLVASSIGHKATCPACKKGVGGIVAVGARTTFLPAGPAARGGDYVACGCPPGANRLLAQGTITIGKHSGNGLPTDSPLLQKIA
jgi:type VI secretion system secreted protein VgrG